VEKSFLICALGVASVAAVEDIRNRRVPNWLTYGAMLSALVVRGIALGWMGLAGSVIGLIGGSALLLILFMLGGIGGGDVKLMGAVGAWVGAVEVFTILTAAAISAAVAGIIYLAVRGGLWETLWNTRELLQHHATSGLKPHPELNLRQSRSVRVPFAPAIALGTLFSIGQTLIWG
jgi:prepilin peptidase CpaA